ncbi:adenosylhomocysteine nucleosidase [Streptacidiphilus sp. MAP12-33]|uniref:nucleosidase n=1 Tax=Streptacidiphilus sp. MAP12-33 TaxID=3156266 RepID=UPI003518B469
MRIVGEIDPTRPLLVLAVAEEAAHLSTDLPLLLTGMGKVNAATAVASVLARGPRPTGVVNLGTAGALKPGLGGLTHEVSQVIQHDLDSAMLASLTGVTYGAPIGLTGRGPVLATGDLFVSDEAARARLAEAADLVDMEGYAIAQAVRQTGLPVRLVKHVSDDAGEGAAQSWRESVDDCAKELARWVAENL